MFASLSLFIYTLFTVHPLVSGSLGCSWTGMDRVWLVRVVLIRPDHTSLFSCSEPPVPLYWRVRSYGPPQGPAGQLREGQASFPSSPLVPISRTTPPTPNPIVLLETPSYQTWRLVWNLSFPSVDQVCTSRRECHRMRLLFLQMTTLLLVRGKKLLVFKWLWVAVAKYGRLQDKL